MLQDSEGNIFWDWKKFNTPSQTHDGVATRWGTIILGIFQKESSGTVCDCTRCEILQLWITSGHCKHHIGILDTFSTPQHFLCAV